MLARDAHVARRNAIQIFLQTFLQPLLFVFIFGRVMVGSGYMPPAYKSLLLPGIIAISMVFTGIWAVAMPLIAEFQWTREIEDRLLAPIGVAWIAIEKVLAGMLQALLSGLIVIPMAWLLLRPGVEISIGTPLTFIVNHCPGRHLLGMRRPRPRLQHQSAAYWAHVRHGHHPHDLFRLHLLSLELPEFVSHPAKDCAHQPARLRQRRPARHPRTPVSPFIGSGRSDCAALL
jgi:hypothetical protein